MKEGRRPEYPEKTPGDELQKVWSLRLVAVFGLNENKRSIDNGSVSNESVINRSMGRKNVNDMSMNHGSVDNKSMDNWRVNERNVKVGSKNSKSEDVLFFNTCLRRIYKIQWQEKIRNADLCERAGQEPVAKQILLRKWGWIGHTLRKPASSSTRQALTWNPQGKRKRGRPRNSWRRYTEVELKQQVTNWSGMTRAAQNRVQWRGVVDGLCSTGSDGHK